MSLATWWHRLVGSGRDRADPPAPGGSGGSGFGSVGGAPPAPGSRGSRAGGTAETPTARGPRAPGTPEERRFAQVYAEDRFGPMPYPNQASPDVALARGRVRAMVDDLLPGGVDEGTGAALDPLIASWASGWLARVDSEHADHHAVIDRLIGGARRQLAGAEAAHEQDRHALEIARRDYADARERLMPPEVAPVPDAVEAGTPPPEPDDDAVTDQPLDPWPRTDRPERAGVPLTRRAGEPR